MSQEVIQAAAAVAPTEAVAPPIPTQSVKMRAVAELEAIPGFTSLGTMARSMYHLQQLKNSDINPIFVRVVTKCTTPHACQRNISYVPRYISEINIWPYEDIEYRHEEEFLEQEDPWSDHTNFCDNAMSNSTSHGILPIHLLKGPLRDNDDGYDDDERNYDRVGHDGDDRVLDYRAEIISYMLLSLDGVIGYLQQQDTAASNTLELSIGYGATQPDGLECHARIPNDIVSRLIKAASKSLKVSTLTLFTIEMDKQLWSDLSDLLLTKVGGDNPLKFLDLVHIVNKCDDVAFLKQLESKFTTKSSHSKTIFGQIEGLQLHYGDNSHYPILFGMFAGHPGLKKFQVDCTNSYDDETLESISRILGTFPKLSAFGFFGDEEDDDEANEIVGMQYLIQGLKKAGSLVDLSFSDVLFDEDKAKEFCQYLSSPPGSNVKKLELADVFSSCRSAARAIMNELRRNSSIKELMLTDDSCGGSFGLASETVALVQENSTLVKLELDGDMFWRPSDPKPRSRSKDGFENITNGSLRTLKVSSVSKDAALKLVKWVGSRKCKIEEFVMKLEYDSRETFKRAIEKLIRNGADRSPPDETDRYRGFLKRLHVKSENTNEYDDDVEQRIQRHIQGLEDAFLRNPFGFEEVFIGTENRTYVTFDFVRQLKFWNDCQSSESSKELFASLAMAPHIFASMSKNLSIMFESMRCHGSVVLPAVLVRGAENLSLDANRDSVPVASKKSRKRYKRSTK